MTALRRLVAACEFASSDDMIRDQLVEHVANPRIRERLLLKEKLTLEQATTIASQMESAGEQAKCMTSVKSSLPVHAVQVQGKGKSRQPYRNARPGSSARNSSASYTPATNSRSCFRCGSDEHLATAPECPAIKVMCKTCNKKGHFARVCRSAAQTHSVRNTGIYSAIAATVRVTSKTTLHCGH